MALSSGYTKWLDERAGERANAKGWNKVKGALAPHKYVQPTWGNLGTGLEVKATHSLIGMAAIGAAAVGWGALQTQGGLAQRRNAAETAEDVGSLPGMNYDAVGNATGGQRNLGATGDLVFGLNNMRRGR